VLIISPAMEDEAWRFFEHQTASDASYTDFVSWAVMRKRGILAALTTDPNFIAAGFDVLPATGELPLALSSPEMAGLDHQ
ncbi:MAG: hypothetical protein HY303_00755, partial [Candidatus Wallbacteria bacterium]|nr:hypothetical protein [Candidatus Wallbacteria bacterium]